MTAETKMAGTQKGYSSRGNLADKKAGFPRDVCGMGFAFPGGKVFGKGLMGEKEKGRPAQFPDVLYDPGKLWYDGAIKEEGGSYGT